MECVAELLRRVGHGVDRGADEHGLGDGVAVDLRHRSRFAPERFFGGQALRFELGGTLRVSFPAVGGHHGAHAGARVHAPVRLQEVVDAVGLEVPLDRLDIGSGHRVLHDERVVAGLLAARRVGTAVRDRAVEADGQHVGVDVTGGASRAEPHEMSVLARRAHGGHRRGGDERAVLEDRAVDVEEGDAGHVHSKRIGPGPRGPGADPVRGDQRVRDAPLDRMTSAYQPNDFFR